MNEMRVVFDEWRQDMYDLEGNLIQKDVLFIRATCGMIAYHCPVWDYEEDKEVVPSVSAQDDTRELLRAQVERHISEDTH